MYNNREEKCVVTKIQISDITGLDGIFRKNKMENVHLPKISPSEQNGGDVQAVSCSDDSIKILLRNVYPSRLIFEESKWS